MELVSIDCWQMKEADLKKSLLGRPPLLKSCQTIRKRYILFHIHRQAIPKNVGVSSQ